MIDQTHADKKSVATYADGAPCAPGGVASISPRARRGVPPEIRAPLLLGVRSRTVLTSAIRRKFFGQPGKFDAWPRVGAGLPS